MGGDVFGNGMLQSPHIRLVGAFNHQHIFLDPEPDAAASFAERKRLFELPRSSWADYDRKLISPGGGVFERAAKSIKLSPEARRRLRTDAEVLTPAELISAILKAPADLLYLGGIGTYVKASGEAQADVGDRANDALRVNGRELRCKVVGEGANLGFTQRGRIEAALAGVRLNTDAVDNSAGVDCSDHEVNLKILLNDPVRAGTLTLEQRNSALREMSDEVAALVLRDNYRQTQAISTVESQGALQLDQQARFMRALEKAGALDRTIEFLPDDETLDRRAAAGQGLTRPELAVLLAYAKMTIYDSLLPSDLPDDPRLAEDLACYFPALVRARFAEAIARHRLRREIIATAVTNEVVNRTSPTFMHVLREKTSCDAAQIARAYIVTRESLALRALWDEVEALDGRVPAALQIEMLRDIARVVEAASLWFLRHGGQPLDITDNLARFGDGIARLVESVREVSGEDDRAAIAARTAHYAAGGVPEPLALRLALLKEVVASLDIVHIAVAAGRRIETVARLDYRVGDRFGFDLLRGAAAQLPAATHWERLANAAILDDLDEHQSALTRTLLETASEGAAEDPIIDAWVETRAAAVQRLMAMLEDLRQGGPMDLAKMAVANRQYRALIGTAS
jgi:glutamate dehydrogenase